MLLYNCFISSLLSFFELMFLCNILRLPLLETRNLLILKVLSVGEYSQTINNLNLP